jgi:hypothetical protein
LRVLPTVEWGEGEQYSMPWRFYSEALKSQQYQSKIKIEKIAN